MKIEDLSIGDWVRVRMVQWDYDDPKTLDAKVLKIEDNGVGLGFDDVVLMWAFVEDCEKIEHYED